MEMRKEAGWEKVTQLLSRIVGKTKAVSKLVARTPFVHSLPVLLENSAKFEKAISHLSGDLAKSSKQVLEAIEKLGGSKISSALTNADKAALISKSEFAEELVAKHGKNWKNMPEVVDQTWKFIANKFPNTLHDQISNGPKLVSDALKALQNSFTAKTIPNLEEVNALIKQGKPLPEILRASGNPDLIKHANLLSNNIEHVNALLSGVSRAASAEGMIEIVNAAKIYREGLVSLKFVPETVMANLPRVFGLASGVLGMGAVVLGPLVGSLFWESSEVIESHKVGAAQLIKKLENLKDKNPAWNEKLNEQIELLSAAAKYEKEASLTSHAQVATNDVEAQKIQREVQGIAENGKILDGLQEAYGYITSKEFNNLYDDFAKGMGRQLGGAADELNFLSGWTGFATTFKQAKELATEQLNKLIQQKQSIEAKAGELNSKFDEIANQQQQQQSGQEQTPQKTASDDNYSLSDEAIFSNYIGAFAAIQAAYNYRATDKIAYVVKKKIIIKNAVGAAAVAGKALEILNYFMLAGDVFNFIIQAYMRLCKDWDDLTANAGVVSTTIRNMAKVKSQDPKVIAISAEMTGKAEEIEQAISALNNSYPTDLKEAFDQGQTEETTKKFAEEMADKVDLVKLKTAISALNILNARYNDILDSEFYDKFDKHMESGAHSVAEVGSEWFTFFSGPGMFDEFSRLKERIKRGQGQILTIRYQIKQILKSSQAAKEKASEQQKP